MGQQKSLITGIVTFTIAFCGLFLASDGAARMNDCGQPATTGSIVTTDGLYVLQAATGSKPCPLCVCDVDNSTVVAATDALIVLAEAASPGSQTLACPAGGTSTCTSCSVSNIRSRMQSLSDDERLTEFTSTIFRCANQTLTLGQGLATVTADNVIISAKDRDLTIQCTSNCDSDSTFGITFSGEDEILEHITLEDFYDCVVMHGDNNTVRNVTLSGFNHSGLDNREYAGTEVRDSTISDGADSNAHGIRSDGYVDTTSTCTSPNDVIYDSTPGARACYNVAVFDTTFSDVEVPVDFEDPGRYLVDGGSMTAPAGGGAGPLFGNDGEPDDTRVRVDSAAIDGFATGLRLYGDNGEHVIDSVTVTGNSKRGIWGGRDSVSTLRSSAVLFNGGQYDSAYPYYGGVATGDVNGNGQSPLIDAGSMSEDGDNLVCCNVDDNNDPLQFHQVDGTITTVGNLSCSVIECD
jgi:hypothetical protein